MLSVGVVVATYNRPEALADLLDDLDAQVVDVPFAVTVVDDGGTAPLDTVIADRGVQLIRRPNGGPGAARHTGIAATPADVVVMLDDDMRVGPGFIQAHLDAHRGGGDVVYGFIESSDDRTDNVDGSGGPGSAGDTLFARFHQRAIDRWLAAYRSGAVPSGSRLCTGNVSVRRAGYEAVGGFDTSLVRCEDRDLGIRLQAAGQKFVLAENARSEHRTDHENIQEWRRRTSIYGQSDQRIAGKHPARPDVSPWAFLDELPAALTPLLVLAAALPRTAAPIGALSYRIATLVDRSGRRTRAVDLAALCYAVDYYRGVGTGTGGFRRVVASYRRWRSAARSARVIGPRGTRP